MFFISHFQFIFPSVLLDRDNAKYQKFKYSIKVLCTNNFILVFGSWGSCADNKTRFVRGAKKVVLRRQDFCICYSGYQSHASNFSNISQRELDLESLGQDFLHVYLNFYHRSWPHQTAGAVLATNGQFEMPCGSDATRVNVTITAYPRYNDYWESHGNLLVTMPDFASFYRSIQSDKRE